MESQIKKDERNAGRMEHWKIGTNKRILEKTAGKKIKTTNKKSYFENYWTDYTKLIYCLFVKLYSHICKKQLILNT